MLFLTGCSLNLLDNQVSALYYKHFDLYTTEKSSLIGGFAKRRYPGPYKTNFRNFIIQGLR